MSHNRRVFHQRGFTLKFNQAVRGIENCALAWIEEGISVRDLTPAEAIQARNKQAEERELLPLAELPGIRYKPQPKDEQGFRHEAALQIAARKFLEETQNLPVRA